MLGRKILTATICDVLLILIIALWTCAIEAAAIGSSIFSNFSL